MSAIAAFVSQAFQTLLGILFFTGLFTFIGAPALKYFARPVGWVRAASIFFWSVFLVLCVDALLHLAAGVFRLSFGLFWGLRPLAGICAVGWLLTHHLSAHYGMPTKFPAVGAKVMVTVLGTVLAVLAVLQLTGHSPFYLYTP
jgi:hypothetical protein